jgi:hypothetical protein
MKPLRFWRALLVLGALVCGAAPPAAAQASDEDRRWAYASERRDPGALQDFLRRFPDSPRAAEARGLLLQSRLQPIGRLSGGEACAAILDTRAQSLLKSYRESPRFAAYDFTVPAGHFAQHSEIEFRPRGVAPDAARIEDLIALDLIARRDGSCTLHLRWGIGSGLPAECRCTPLDTAYVFESRLAQQVLGTYSQFLGASSACATVDLGAQASAEAYLDEWISGYTQRLQTVRDRQQRGASVFPSEAGEADDTEFALPRVRARTVQQALYEQARRAVLARTAEDLSSYCRDGLPRQIEGARMRTLLSTRPQR